MEYEMISLDKLKPLEMVFKHHLMNLEKIIFDSKHITSPIIADKDNHIILDGSHRYVLFLMKGHKYTPVKLVDYNDEHIRVGSHLKHRFLDDGNITLSKQEVIYRGNNGILLPPRTTRHFFPFRKTDSIDVSIDSIETREGINVSRFISNDDVTKEIKHNEKYIKEINEEMNEILNYIKEQNNTKEYLIKQIEMMKNY